MPLFTVKNLEIIVTDTGDTKQKTNHKIFETTNCWKASGGNFKHYHVSAMDLYVLHNC